MKYPTFSISLAIWKLLTHSQGTNGQSTTRGSYVPVTNVHCPDVFTRRTLDQQFQLDPREREYIDGRRALLPEAWSQWLRDPSTLGYSAQDLKLVSGADVPSIALASSGGSFRSALFSAGALTAFDIRNDTAKAIGTGGLLQVSQYHSGLSGGSWIATSLAINDLPVPRDLVLGNVHQGGNLTGWLLDRDLLLPDGIRAIDFYEDIVDQVRSKANAGFDTGLTDIWSRALAYHLLPGTSEQNFFSDDESTHGAGVLYSDLQKIPRFTQKQMPFPLIVVNARPPLFEDAPPGTNLPLESTVYEVTPFEFGSYDPHLAAFVDVKYLGTELNELKPKSSDSCVTNFDQADFVAGSSSSLFFALLYDSRRKLNGIEAKAADFLFKALNNLLKGISTRADDVGVVPNPFRGLGVGQYEDANSPSLELIDGGSNLEQLPLRPLLMKPRGVEVIVTLDGSSDNENDFPTLLGLIQTQRHEGVVAGVAQPLPPLPSEEIAVRDQLNLRPTFFGCDPSSVPEWPLVISLPNAPPADGSLPVTNTDTFKLTYTDRHSELFLDQAFGTATSGFVPGQLGADPEWAQCLQCAVVDRQRFKHQPVIPRSQQCQRCFSRYCYDPANPPRAEDLKVVGRQFKFTDPDPQKGFFERNKKTIIIVASVVGVVLLLGILTCIFCFIKRRARAKIDQVTYSQLRGDVPLPKVVGLKA
ncbi:Lysophospholipase 1 [Serendipita sp. 407]|nr:Lysophospholipase 1 [Serendipita sp. 407]